MKPMSSSLQLCGCVVTEYDQMIWISEFDLQVTFFHPLFTEENNIYVYSVL
jgi:hypothetical protein